MESNKDSSEDKGLFMLTSLNYEGWAPKAMKYLLAYPGPWEWIKTGMEPTFNTPPLEILAEAPPRRVQPRARGRINEGGRAERRRGRARERGFAELAEAEEDEEQEEEREQPADQVVMIRNPIYAGEGGKEDWRETLRNNKRNLEIL